MENTKTRYFVDYDHFNQTGEYVIRVEVGGRIFDVARMSKGNAQAQTDAMIAVNALNNAEDFGHVPAKTRVQTKDL